MLYETTAQFVEVDKNGNDKVRKQKFIVVDAANHGDAEEQTFEECDGHTDLDVVAVKRSKIKEILNSRSTDEERIFIAHVVDVQIDEEGEEKELVYKMALYASSFDKAHSFMNEWLKQGYNMRLDGVTRTSFVDTIG